MLGRSVVTDSLMDRVHAWRHHSSNSHPMPLRLHHAHGQPVSDAGCNVVWRNAKRRA